MPFCPLFFTMMTDDRKDTAQPASLRRSSSSGQKSKTFRPPLLLSCCGVLKRRCRFRLCIYRLARPQIGLSASSFKFVGRRKKNFLIFIVVNCEIVIFAPIDRANVCPPLFSHSLPPLQQTIGGDDFRRGKAVRRGLSKNSSIQQLIPAMMIDKYLVQTWGNKMFEKEIAKIVSRHATLAAFVAFLPMLGFELLLYIGVLWHMYSALCKKADTQLHFGNIIVGFVVNIVVAIIVDLAFSFIPIFGWLTSGAIIYIQFYLSGKGYIETLRSESTSA